MKNVFFVPFVFSAVYLIWCQFFCAALSWASVYEVGPEKPFSSIGQVPWNDLLPGDTVLIHYRVEPYREKWVVDRAGTASTPIIIRGIPGPQGQLPVIDGSMAVTSQKLNFWSEERGIINIGGSNLSNQQPAYLIIEGLDIRNARSPYWFKDDHGQIKYYSKNAASIYVIEGNHITIRNCLLHNCGNGFFACHSSSNILVEGCWIFDNGIENSYYQHNNYTEAKGIIFQFNHFGPLRDGCGGNNLKDRSAGTIIRYNWIEGGNRQLDLVDSNYQEFIDMPEYRKTYVYGNILVERSNEGNSQIIHYGGDSGDRSRYRKGILYLYNNTIISKRNGNTTLLRLSSQDETCWAANNILYVTDSGNRLALLNREGALRLKNNWIKTNWVGSHEGSGFSGTIIDLGGNLEGSAPGFQNFSSDDFHLASNSICRNSGADLQNEISETLGVTREYEKHQQSRIRPEDGVIDIGAFEFAPSGPVNSPPVITLFSADKDTVENPMTMIHFSAEYTDPDGDPVSILLDFGDGVKSLSLPVTHAYEKKGTYDAKLKVTDGKGGSASRSLSISVLDKIPEIPSDLEAQVP